MPFSALKGYDEMVKDADFDVMQDGEKNNSPRTIYLVKLSFEGIREYTPKGVSSL